MGFTILRFFADILLSPLEATRIRLVSNPKVSRTRTLYMICLPRTCAEHPTIPIIPQYASGLASGLAKITANEGIAGLYAGFLPLLCKQVPYAIGQFTVNEFCHELVYKSITKEQKANLSEASRWGITLGSGVTAGIAAAILSHVSKPPNCLCPVPRTTKKFGGLNRYSPPSLV